MKAVVAAFNQEKALVGAFSVITNLRMELFEALVREQPVVVKGSITGALSRHHHLVITSQSEARAGPRDQRPGSHWLMSPGAPPPHSEFIRIT